MAERGIGRLQAGTALFKRLAAGRGLFRWSGPPEAAGNAPQGATLPQSPQTLSGQWDRLSSIISGAVSGAEQAGQLHHAATRQIDLAQYALASLVDELSGVMAVRDKRPLAVVHVFEPSSQRPGRKQLAA